MADSSPSPAHTSISWPPTPPATEAQGIAPSGANASLSLLNATSTGLADSIGAYVTTDANGSFTITGDYNCTPNTQVYLYALGGNPGAGINSAAGLLAALGNCPASGSFLASLPFVQVNEVTTIAAAYAMAGFATDATHVSSSGTPLAQTGIANAFANATNLADITTGAALDYHPRRYRHRSSSHINTLAEHPRRLYQLNRPRINCLFDTPLHCAR